MQTRAEYYRNYYKKNKDKLKEYQKKYASKHKDVILRNHKRWLAKNKEKVKLQRSQKLSDRHGTKIEGGGIYNRRLYSCCLCDKKFHKRYDLLEHKRNDHSY